jgi:hypothetical protein
MEEQDQRKENPSRAKRLYRGAYKTHLFGNGAEDEM